MLPNRRTIKSNNQVCVAVHNNKLYLETTVTIEYEPPDDSNSRCMVTFNRILCEFCYDDDEGTVLFQFMSCCQ